MIVSKTIILASDTIKLSEKEYNTLKLAIKGYFVKKWEEKKGFQERKLAASLYINQKTSTLMK